MKKQVAIKAENLTKVYKIFEKPIDRIKESINPFHKRYSKDFYALKEISFSLNCGDTLGIIGKNGAGKSTLLKLITGVLTPTSGMLQVKGKIASLLELGAGFNPEMTGIENVYLSGTVMGYNKRQMDEKLQDIIEFADIGDFIYQPVKMYSSGMFARLAFSVNAHIKPDILIVDEALSVGDIEFQSKCYRKFNELREKGITILFVTHDINAILKFCNVAFLMDKGKIVGSGTAKDIVDLYKKSLMKDGEDHSSLAINNLSKERTYMNKGCWKDYIKINKSLIEYGDKFIEIVDFAIMDSNGQILTVINSEQIIHIKMKLIVRQDVANPIFAVSIKDLKGTEILGTNTNIMRTNIGGLKPGSNLLIDFRQRLSIRPGDYMLSLGCTEYTNTGLTIHHRLYDVILFQVVSSKEIVGLVDMDSEVQVQVLGNGI